MAGFSCIPRTIGGEMVVLDVGSDIDMSNCDDLVERVRAWLTPSVRLIVAVGGITFLDSSGLRGLLEIQKAAADNGAEFALAEISEPVRRVLELSGTSEAFAVADDLPQTQRG